MPRYNGGFIGTDGLDAPDPPTDVTPTAGDQQLSIAFTAPTDTGTSAITGFVAQVASSGDNYSAGSNTGSSSPIVITSLSNGTSYTAKVWAINAYGTSAPSVASSAATPVPASRALVAGGEAPSSAVNTISYDDITTSGNFSDFGDLTTVAYKGAAVGASTRIVFAHGNGGNVMSYVTPSSTGNSTDFGDVGQSQTQEFGGTGNETYGFFFGGSGHDNVINYITIASTGNTSDFGNLNTGVEFGNGMSSTTRAIVSGGSDNASDNTIQYFTIGTSGSASDFGNLTVAHASNPGCCSSPTRGLTAGGGSSSDEIEYITIASTGNGTDFGDLPGNIYYGPTGLSSHTIGLFAGGTGWPGSSSQNTVHQVTIASIGNSTDWGDLSYTPAAHSMGSTTRHGGIA